MTLAFLGMGMMVEVLKHAGMRHSSSEALKMLVNTGASWSAQCFRADGETESGPAAFRGFGLLNRFFTCLSVTEKGGEEEGVRGWRGAGGGGVAGGSMTLLGCRGGCGPEVWREGAGGNSFSNLQ